MNDIIAFFPFILAVFSASFEEMAHFNDSNYFNPARDKARKNIKSRILHKCTECSENQVLQAIDNWPFACFREALLRKYQNTFISMMATQCFLTSLLIFNVLEVTPNAFKTSTPYSTPLILGVTFCIFLIYSVRQQKTFSWFNSHNSIESTGLFSKIFPPNILKYVGLISIISGTFICLKYSMDKNNNFDLWHLTINICYENSGYLLMVVLLVAIVITINIKNYNKP